MSLLCLKVTNFRNLCGLDIEPAPHMNLICGVNGSGKTSILEAIYFLSVGRSFRSHLASRMINHNKESFSVFGLIQTEEGREKVAVGVEKTARSKLKIKIGNSIAPSIASLASMLPIQIINPESSALLNLGPRKRREFLDWGLFHVEQTFFVLWQRFQRILNQRNSALQQNVPLSQVKIWDSEFVTTAMELAKQRETYLQGLFPIVSTLLLELLKLSDITISYNKGWDEQHELAEILNSTYKRDAILGYTQFGPQRADIEVRINNIPVQDVLSRGEQKVLVCVLRLAQGILLRQLAGKNCVFLLDDLAAELDRENQHLIMNVLTRLESQIFITSTDDTIIDNLDLPFTTKLFHVEQGRIHV